MEDRELTKLVEVPFEGIIRKVLVCTKPLPGPGFNLGSLNILGTPNYGYKTRDMFSSDIAVHYNLNVLKFLKTRFINRELFTTDVVVPVALESFQEVAEFAVNYIKLYKQDATKFLESGAWIENVDL